MTNFHNYIDNDHVCPCCRLEKLIDSLDQFKEEFLDIILNNEIEQDLIPLVDDLEDCFTTVNRAKVKLYQARGLEVVLVNNKLNYFLPEEEEINS